MTTPSIFCVKNLRNLEKSCEGDADDSSSISRLPDEIILQIFNKLIDLKTLFFCYLLSRRFSSIVLQVDVISFTVPRINPPIPDKNTVGDVAPSSPLLPIISSLRGGHFNPAFRFLSKFVEVKSICVEFPSSSDTAIGNRCLFKWKAKFGNRIKSFMFLSPNSVCDKDGFSLSGSGDEEEDYEFFHDLLKQKSHISFQCLNDALTWNELLLEFVKDLPVLEKVSITDSGRTGRVSLSGKKLSEVKEWIHSASENEFNHVEVPNIVCNCYIPVLNLPVSGYVMKGIYVGLMEMKDFQGGYDDLMNSEDGFEDKEEAAYTEAMMQILEKHKDMMVMVDDV